MFQQQQQQQIFFLLFSFNTSNVNASLTIKCNETIFLYSDSEANTVKIFGNLIADKKQDTIFLSCNIFYTHIIIYNIYMFDAAIFNTMYLVLRTLQ